MKLTTNDFPPGCKLLLRQPGFATSTDRHFTSGVVDRLYITEQREVRNQELYFPTRFTRRLCQGNVGNLEEK